MPHAASERVPCDCNLQHTSLIAICTRHAHHRMYEDEEEARVSWELGDREFLFGLIEKVGKNVERI